MRGEEYAMILKPRLKHLDILGLGSSIATPSSGIQAEAIVVHSFDELERRASEVHACSNMLVSEKGKKSK